MTDKEKKVIEAFVAFLREQHGHPGLKVDRWPDQENRTTPDIDAVAGPFAIEHTSIDTIPNQRWDSGWLKDLFDEIHDKFEGKLSFRLRITLEWKSVPKKQCRPLIRNAMIRWIDKEAPLLMDGCHVLQDIPDIPFRLHIRKSGDRPPGILFARFDPNDTTLPDRVREKFCPRVKKLAKYQPSNKTILLVESDDMALMNHCILLDAIKTAYSDAPPPGVDQVWYADTSVPEADAIFTDFTHELCV